MYSVSSWMASGAAGMTLPTALLLLASRHTSIALIGFMAAGSVGICVQRCNRTNTTCLQAVPCIRASMIGMCSNGVRAFSVPTIQTRAQPVRDFWYDGCAVAAPQQIQCPTHLKPVAIGWLLSAAKPCLDQTNQHTNKQSPRTFAISSSSLPRA